jgi:hypothetical protein
MSFSKASLVAAGIGALALAIGVSRLAGAATQQPIADLSNNEGIYVELKTFKVHRGMAKTDPQAQITKLGARPVNEGAIIFRAGDQLYIVDAAPGGTPMYLLYEGAFAPGG